MKNKFLHCTHIFVFNVRKLSCDWPSQREVQLDCMCNTVDTDCRTIERIVEQQFTAVTGEVYWTEKCK
jgi:hypothetical protein